jgi:hypothetical protein
VRYEPSTKAEDLWLAERVKASQMFVSSANIKSKALKVSLVTNENRVNMSKLCFIKNQWCFLCLAVDHAREGFFS